MKFLDTNVFLRYLTRDDETKAQACFILFKKIELGDEDVLTNETIVAELAYVLSSRAHYNLTHDEIRSRLAPLIKLRSLRLPHKQLCLRALDVYADHPSLDFEDALSVATMESESIAEIYSYDRDFDQIAMVQRVEP